MACNKPSYWTQRRRAKEKVEKQLQSIEAIPRAEESGDMFSSTCENDDDVFMDCLSQIDETEYMASVLDDSESDADSESDTESDSTFLENDLATWAIEHKITHVALNSLLNILRQHNLTLQKTPGHC